ncbi:MAG TPA: ABC transporter ATP-binding protein [Candidatus Limnocylindrales bacterium]|nr:ABC transporter ATP-binding protein [Candidatus Limnocylindrales bacterium]
MTDLVPTDRAAIAGPPIVEFRAVTLAYGRREIVRAADLSIAPGERVALVGPNGAGKSTLLRALTGLLAPVAGQVEVDGRDVADFDRAALARRIAVVPQLAVLPFSARVEEIVALGRLPHEDPIRGPRPADRAAVAEAMDRVGLGRLLGRDARELSLGERQLVLVALAIAQAAPIVVLDEPTVHLDLRHQVEVMELLVDLNARDGTTVLAVLHDLNLAARYFPRVLVVADGRIAADGPPADVLTAARIRDVFGVDPGILWGAPWSPASADR